ncbi:MAG: hypothetical protein ACYCT3_11655 [Acidiferrobacter sp.]
MNARKADRRQRRESLISRAMAQRDEVSYVTAQLQNRLRWAEIGWAVGHALRAHPILPVAGASGLMRVTKTQRLLWASGLVVVWALCKIVRRYRSQPGM